MMEIADRLKESEEGRQKNYKKFPEVQGGRWRQAWVQELAIRRSLRGLQTRTPVGACRRAPMQKLEGRRRSRTL